MTKEEWDSKQNASKKQFKYMPTGTAGQVEKVEVKDSEEEGEPTLDNETAEISPETKMNWNKYLSWLDEKKMKGKPELDKGGLGNKLFNQYLKENPKSGLSTDMIPDIRKAYIKLRESNMKDIIQNKGTVEGKSGKDIDFNRFMAHIIQNEKSKNPNYVGQHLTQTPFPGLQLKQKETGEILKSSPVYNIEQRKTMLN